jgi:hypothetical protein
MLLPPFGRFRSHRRKTINPIELIHPSKMPVRRENREISTQEWQKPARKCSVERRFPEKSAKVAAIPANPT